MQAWYTKGASDMSSDQHSPCVCEEVLVCVRHRRLECPPLCQQQLLHINFEPSTGQGCHAVLFAMDALCCHTI